MSLDARYHRSFVWNRPRPMTKADFDRMNRQISKQPYSKAPTMGAPSGRSGGPPRHRAIYINGATAEEITIEEKSDQNFEKFATSWEMFWSRLIITWVEWRFLPVVDQQANVVGHCGIVEGQNVLMESLPTDQEDLAGIPLTKPGEYLKQRRIYVGTKAFFQGMNLKTFPSRLWYTVVTDIYGEVTAIEFARYSGDGQAISVGIGPLELITIFKTGFKLVTQLGKQGIRTAVRTVPQNLRARITGDPHNATNRWFARSLPNGGRLHMSRGYTNQDGLIQTIKRNKREGRRQVVLSGTHGGDTQLRRGGKLDWEESAPGGGMDGRDFLREDIKVLTKNGHSDVRVMDITRMSETELRNVFNSGGDIYAGFCESACSVAIRRAFEEVTRGRW